MFLFNIGRMARAHEGRGGVVIELKGEREALNFETYFYSTKDEIIKRLWITLPGMMKELLTAGHCIGYNQQQSIFIFRELTFPVRVREATFWRVSC